MALFTDFESSNIHGFDHDNDNLIVVFKTKAVYVYKGVPTDLYQQLLAAESKGKFLNSNIKGKFEFEKVGDVHAAK